MGRATGRLARSVANLDRLLLGEGTPYGPVVAIGNPGDQFPPYGAARGYFDDKTWRGAVLDLAEKAMAIILCVDDTEGVWWEVEHVAARFPDKTLILIHPKHMTAEQNTSVLEKLSRALAAGPAGSLLLLNRDFMAGRPVLGIFTNAVDTINAARSSTFSRIAFLVIVRTFLRSKWGLAKRPGQS